MDAEEIALAKALLEEACRGVQELLALPVTPAQRVEYEGIAVLYNQALERLRAGDEAGTRKVMGEAQERIARALRTVWAVS